MKNFIRIALLICAILPIGLIAQPEYHVEGKIYTSLEKALSEPDSVVILKLRRKGYEAFPMEVFKFKNMKELDLGNNKISSLPSNIGELENLEILNLERNKFTSVGKEIGSLRRIRYLDFGMNSIQALPHEMGNLINLEFLQIWGNEITALPRSMEKLENLKWLDMRTIILTTSEREELQEMFPQTEILLSPDCNCGK